MPPQNKTTHVATTSYPPSQAPMATPRPAPFSTLSDELDPGDHDYPEEIYEIQLKPVNINNAPKRQQSFRGGLNGSNHSGSSREGGWFGRDKQKKNNNARGEKVRNFAKDFIAGGDLNRSYDRSDDISVLSGESSRSMMSTQSSQSMQSTRSIDSKYSIVSALLGTSRVPQSVLADQTTEITVVSDLRLASLCRVLMSSERSDGIPNEYSKGNALARRMRDILTYPLDKAPNWLWNPLFEGLMNGKPAINAQVTPPSGAQNMPLITWLCQYKSLQKLFHWKGENDVVSMALHAGADPNVAMSNGSTPVFFAVKYGSLETVKLLVKYGADLTIKDNKGRTCLWNALERPVPDMLAYLLETLSATEAFPYRRMGRKVTAYQTAMDYLFASQLSFAFDPVTNPDYPWSWQVLGAPTEEDVALSMIEFGKRGTSFSANDITLALLGFVLRGDNPNKRRNRYPKYEEARERLGHLANLTMGRWLPESVLEGVKNEPSEPKTELEESIDEEKQSCHLCSEDIEEPNRRRIKLYCGHAFCRGCILGHGNGTNMDLTCPVCYKTLCLELTGNVNRRWECLTETYGENWNGRYGPQVLTSEQLRLECQTRGITTVFRNDQKLRNILNDVVVSSVDHKRIPPFDLNTNIPITDGSEITLLPPKGGPVAVPIIVKGIPVTAFVSTTSQFTLLSPEFVEIFGITKTKLSSDTFTSVLGREFTEGTLVDEFKFTLGGICVRLRNSLETELPNGVGVQLGRDFLRSGAWCVIETKIDGKVEERNGSYICTDGFGHTSYSRTGRTQELRYYAFDGRTVRIPLLHIQPFRDGSLSNWRSVEQRESFVECNWCCRVFPPGGMLHEAASVYYCTEACKADAQDARNATDGDAS